MNSQNFRREFSAGCVVYQPGQPVKYLIGKHSGYHKWVLPKGLIEKGEKGSQTALRETAEEMGVKAQLVSQEPIHKEQYFFYADYKDKQDKGEQSTRRVEKYQESFDKKDDQNQKTKVLKTVTFYLAKFKSGDPEDHGWEMSTAGWYDYEKARGLMAFKGEKQALKKAREKLKELSNQPKLLE